MTGGGYADLFVSASDGLRLYTRDYGPRLTPALPVVCLPGLARTSADFHDLALALARNEARPRRVLAFDYRGRGRSDYDRNWRNYDIRIELGDLLQVLTAVGIGAAIVVGTSRGGLIAMALAAARPCAIAGVVLNDVGPVIEGRGLARIRSYVGQLPELTDEAAGGEILKRLAGARFPALSDEDWQVLARATWKRTGARLVPDYDAALLRMLQTIDLEAPLPPLWFLFQGLKRVPVLALRGANSDVLSEETLQAMASMHPDLETVTVPGQGHAPALHGRNLIDRIRDFVVRVEAGAPAQRRFPPTRAP